MTYQCPLCENTLIQNSGSYTCEHNHQFDIAKEGYVNLMPVQHKRSKDPGDNKEMMTARRQFLATGHYHPLRDAIGNLLQKNQVSSLLDIGCGEGYYTDYFRGQLTAANHKASVYGLDISKIAIRYAAKSYPDSHFCVASSQRLPFTDNGLDAVVRIYAPCNDDELMRVVKDKGIVITVTPAGRHLYQLKSLIYQDVRLHDETPENIPNFSLINEQALHYTMSLSGENASHLLQMTPFAWKASESVKFNLAQQSVFECDAHFMIRIYQKISPPA
ncbi:23S rRNA (guanine(745)-N(1))-methyltransferase [Vibrio sp. WJH972]